MLSFANVLNTIGKNYSKYLLSFLIFSILSVFPAIRYFFLLGHPKTPNTPNTPYTPIRLELFIIKYAIIEYVVGGRAPIGARLPTIFEDKKSTV